MKLKQIITGIIFVLLMVSATSISAVEPLKTATLGFEHGWGGGIMYGMFIRFNSTEDLTNETIPELEMNMWITEGGSPYFPNYSLQFWQFNTYDFKWPGHNESYWTNTYVSDLDPVILDEPADNLAWTIRNETFDWDAGNLSRHTDGRFYLSIVWRGVVWVNGTVYAGTALNQTWFAGLATLKATYDPTIITDVEMHHPFMFRTPVDELKSIVYPPIYPAPPETTTTTVPTTTTTDIETTTDITPFGYIFALAIAALVIRRKNKQRKG